MDEQSIKPIEITVQLTFEDYRHAARAHAPLKPSFFFFASDFMALAGAGLLLMFDRDVGSVLITLSIILFLTRVFNAHGLLKDFENNKKLWQLYT